ncbi:unnamed protein product [Owenia fusiformis]|uniref:Uncharacterized protein n=1 Tax=Owenia fusiformis TaxID=6347 RepID=A0A8J1U6T8_OWEFU|nr:unnamed protein product [Owenia fusiformis]
MIMENISWNETGEEFRYRPPFQRQIVPTQIVMPLIQGLIGVIGVVGNSMVVYVLCTRLKQRGNMNVLLMNLAIADFFFIIFCVPVNASYHALYEWPFGEAFCKITHYVKNITAYVSIYSLCAVSITRYLTVVKSAKSSHLRTKRSAIISAVLLWLIIATANIPVMKIYFTITMRLDRFTSKTICSYQKNSKDMEILTATFFTMSYAIPVIIICLTHILILVHITKNSSNITASSIQRRKNASRIIIGTTIAFAICWLPMNILMMMVHCFKMERKGFMIPALIAECMSYANSCTNPIVYNFVSKDFRTALGQSIGLCSHIQLPTNEPSHTGTLTTKVASSKNGESVC